MGFFRRLAGLAIGFTVGWLCISSGGLLWGSLMGVGGSLITRALGLKYTTLGIWGGIAVRFKWVALTYGTVKLVLTAVAAAEAAAALAAKGIAIGVAPYVYALSGPYPWWDATQAWTDWIGTARWAPYGTW